MEWYLRTLLTQVDSSLADEWERLRDPDYRPEAETARAEPLRPPGAEQAERDVTADARQFTAAIRARIFAFLRAWAIGDPDRSRDILDDPLDGDDMPWNPARLRETLNDYLAGHERVRFDPEARNLRHTYVRRDGGRTWRVQQVLVDPEMINDWIAEFEVDVDASRDAHAPVMRLARLGPLAV
jgi:hypothetical protein